jgi:hypothetical protein
MCSCKSCVVDSYCQKNINISVYEKIKQNLSCYWKIIYYAQKDMHLPNSHAKKTWTYVTTVNCNWCTIFVPMGCLLHPQYTNTSNVKMDATRIRKLLFCFTLYSHYCYHPLLQYHQAHFYCNIRLLNQSLSKITSYPATCWCSQAKVARMHW